MNPQQRHIPGEPVTVAVPKITAFIHKHGVSIGLCPAGEDLAEYWKREDDHDPSNEEEYIEEMPLPSPYAAAPDLLEALRGLREDIRMLRDGEWDGSANGCNSSIEIADSAISKATNTTP